MRSKRLSAGRSGGCRRHQRRSELARDRRTQGWRTPYPRPWHREVLPVDVVGPESIPVRKAWKAQAQGCPSATGLLPQGCRRVVVVGHAPRLGRETSPTWAPVSEARRSRGRDRGRFRWSEGRLSAVSCPSTTCERVLILVSVSVDSTGSKEAGRRLDKGHRATVPPCGGRPVVWRTDTWLILPVVICLSQRLSHACLSINCLYCETANGSLNQL